MIRHTFRRGSPLTSQGSRGETGSYDGVGFALDGKDGLAGFDFDHYLDADGNIKDPRIAELVHRLNSYCEISPSGTGLRVFVFAVLPAGGRKKGGIECYERGRYLTVTGRHLSGTPTTIESRQEEVEAVHADVFAARNHRSEQTNQEQREERSTNHVNDQELLKYARQANNGEKFKKLYDQGDISGYSSPSEADPALCMMLAFWTRKDAARIDRLFRASKLMRGKWDEDHYRKPTIDKAIANCRETWPGPQIKEAPRPLYREIAPGEPFPIDALGKLGAAAARDLQRATQAHPSICGPAILSKMNLVTMGHVDIELPHGETRPISDYFLTIAESGERKTSADNRAAIGIVEHQNDQEPQYRREYFEYKNALEAYEKERNDILTWKGDKDEKTGDLEIRIIAAPSTGRT
jgi:hypothetical protein